MTHQDILNKYKRFWGTSTPGDRIKIMEVLSCPKGMLTMKTACRLGKPAVEPLSEVFETLVPIMVADPIVKCLVGACAKELLLEESYTQLGVGVCRSKNCIFTSATKYAPPVRLHRMGYGEAESFLD